MENEARAQLPSKQGTTPEQTSALEESIFKLSGQLSTINRNQKYFRTRENRNFSTVRSTEQRIFNFSVVESGLMVCMAGLQVFIVRFFFQGARKGESALALPYWSKDVAIGLTMTRICVDVGIKERSFLYGLAFRDYIWFQALVLIKHFMQFATRLFANRIGHRGITSYHVCGHRSMDIGPVHVIECQAGS